MAKKNGKLTARVVIQALGSCEVPEYVTERMTPEQAFAAMMDDNYYLDSHLDWLTEVLHIKWEWVGTKEAVKKLRKAYPQMSPLNAERLVTDNPYEFGVRTWKEVAPALAKYLKSKRGQNEVKRVLAAENAP